MFEVLSQLSVPEETIALEKHSNTKSAREYVRAHHFPSQQRSIGIQKPQRGRQPKSSFFSCESTYCPYTALTEYVDTRELILRRVALTTLIYPQIRHNNVNC